MEFNYNDGGRAEAGFKGKAGDCVCRAISIATGKSYKEVYDFLAENNASQRKSKNQVNKRPQSANNRIQTKRKWFNDYMLSLGFTWIPTMKIGEGCKVHLKVDELPTGRLVCSLSKHMVAVIDGVVNDTYDPSRGETRCVYGYYILKS